MVLPQLLRFPHGDPPRTQLFNRRLSLSLSLSWPGLLASRPWFRPSVLRFLRGAVLCCLEHLGLGYNRGIGPVKGAPNAWQLTARGRHVEQAICMQTTPPVR